MPGASWELLDSAGATACSAASLVIAWLSDSVRIPLGCCKYIKMIELLQASRGATPTFSSFPSNSGQQHRNDPFVGLGHAPLKDPQL